MPDDSLPPGYLDLHCHLLPGVDDGCRDLAATLKCIAMWQDAGFVGSVCTPHMASTWFREVTPQRVEQWLGQLQADLRAAGMEYRLWPGGEVRLSERVLAWFARHGVPTLGPGRCVLVDWWGNDWPDYCTAACQWLLEEGYQPILAHPERMGLDDHELAGVINTLTSQGVWLQGNLNSVSGGEGPAAQSRADDFLAEGRYHLLASDTHDPGTTPSRIAGLNRLASLHDDPTLQRLLAQHTREALHHGL